MREADDDAAPAKALEAPDAVQSRSNAPVPAKEVQSNDEDDSEKDESYLGVEAVEE